MESLGARAKSSNSLWLQILVDHANVNERPMFSGFSPTNPYNNEYVLIKLPESYEMILADLMALPLFYGAVPSSVNAGCFNHFAP